ncbi:uncharacterized protein F4817DRAFT_367540 [Daldinia loculata]|uniref:uncharacterized protein n=1 Tax=Daldinia loculata TaxID=103429 RepID=UPI0020C2DB1E|nr:uncharacterized protein F4817DRAFT_367540 [Daldinia loculata]KAI1650998.1 hypothetical protein F4817DRAFT_367540 [Daldinia loculata]
METHLSQQPDQPSSSQRQYTTVGSVWNPQSMPLQPPARRGRALRSAMPMSMLEPYPDDSFNTFGTAQPYSHSQYYSPLQQNFDRAVSPVQATRILTHDNPMHTDHPHYLDNLVSPGSSAPKRISEFKRQYPSTPSVDMPQKIVPAIPLLPGTAPVNPHKQGEANNHYGNEGNNYEQDDVEEEEDMNVTLNNMSTKTLTNLASYSNPMQKAAQKVLTKARQAPPVPHHQVSDSISQNGSGLNFPPGFGPRNTRSDPVGVESLLQSDRFDGRNHNQHPTPLHLGVTTNTAREHDSYPAVLSKGPGAPQPLTAGPPGQRHFQPSAFDGAPSSLRKGFEKPHEFDTFGDGLPRHQPFSCFQSQQPMQPTPRQPTPSYKSETFSCIHPPALFLSKESNPSIRMVDTLTYEKAKTFFPKGLPPDFNFHTQPVTDDWAEKHMKEEEDKEKRKKNKLLWQQTPEFQAAHKDKLDRDFYNGNYMINKNLRVAIHEKYTRDITRSLGSKSQEYQDSLKLKPENKVEGRYISVEDANSIPTHEHAEPLLSVLYQSLERNQGLYSQQKPPNNSGLR